MRGEHDNARRVFERGTRGARLTTKGGAAVKTLDADKQLISDLWLDQLDAHERIDERLGAGELSDPEAEKLRNFADNGYMTVSLGLDSAFSDNFDAELDRLWRERPVDLAAAPKSGGRVSFRDIDERHRSIGYRVADLHSHSQLALDLYLHPEVFRLVELVLGQQARRLPVPLLPLRLRAVAAPRPRCSWSPGPPSHLVAVWIASGTSPTRAVRSSTCPARTATRGTSSRRTRSRSLRKGGGPIAPGVDRSPQADARAFPLDVQRFTC